MNGDGRSGDRAFIPDPSREADATLAAQMKALVGEQFAERRETVSSPVSAEWPRATAVAGRGRSRSTSSGDRRFRERWANRVTPNVYFQNVLAGVDQLVHGSESLRGWGSQATPDPVLLVPRGFDARCSAIPVRRESALRRTRVGRAIGRDPFRIVIDFSFNLSVDYDLQQLRRAVEPVRDGRGLAASIRGFTRGVLSLEHFQHLQVVDRSKRFALSEQGSGLSAPNRRFGVLREGARNHIPLGQFLAQGQGGAGKAELDSVRATQKKYWKIFWEQPEIAGAIVTPSQRELMPMFKSMLATPMKDREHSQWQFGYPMTFADKPRTK